jgi:hypothetical protein
VLCDILDDVNVLVEYLREQVRLANHASGANAQADAMRGKTGKLQGAIAKKCKSVIRHLDACI